MKEDEKEESEEESDETEKSESETIEAAAEKSKLNNKLQGIIFIKSLSYECPQYMFNIHSTEILLILIVVDSYWS